MRAILTTAILALAGAGLVGLAAADNGDDCQYGATPVPNGYYDACVFEENQNSYSYDYCSWYGCYQGSQTWTENHLTYTYLYQNLGPVNLGLDAWVYQYEGSGWYDHRDNFVTQSGTWSYDGTEIGFWQWHSMPFLYTNNGASLYQYDAQGQNCSNRWGCSDYDEEYTGVWIYTQVGPGYQDIGYDQGSSNGGACTEQVYISNSFGGYQTPSQACTVEAPQLMDDPNTQFPDWPDGTGLPFL